MSLRDLAQRAIDRLNRIGGINDALDHLWEGEQRNDTLPIGPPRFAHGGILLIPFLSKHLQLKFLLIGGRRQIDRFQVSRYLLSQLTIDVFERIAHHAQVHLDMRKDRFNGFWQASEAIRTGNETVLHAAIGEFDTPGEPEFGPFIF